MWLELSNRLGTAKLSLLHIQAIRSGRAKDSNTSPFLFRNAELEDTKLGKLASCHDACNESGLSGCITSSLYPVRWDGAYS